MMKAGTLSRETTAEIHAMFGEIKPGVISAKVLKKKLEGLGLTSDYRGILSHLQERLVIYRSDWRLVVVEWRTWGDKEYPVTYEKIHREELIARRIRRFRRKPPMVSRLGVGCVDS